MSFRKIIFLLPSNGNFGNNTQMYAILKFHFPPSSIMRVENNTRVYIIKLILCCYLVGIVAITPDYLSSQIFIFCCHIVGILEIMLSACPEKLLLLSSALGPCARPPRTARVGNGTDQPRDGGRDTRERARVRGESPLAGDRPAASGHTHPHILQGARASFLSAVGPQARL